jgi:hypothetical protein
MPNVVKRPLHEVTNNWDFRNSYKVNAQPRRDGTPDTPTLVEQFTVQQLTKSTSVMYFSELKQVLKTSIYVQLSPFKTEGYLTYFNQSIKVYWVEFVYKRKIVTM